MIYEKCKHNYYNFKKEIIAKYFDNDYFTRPKIKEIIFKILGNIKKNMRQIHK